MTTIAPPEVRFGPDGLIPAVVQDVADGRVLRSFREGHEQLSLVDGRLRAGAQRWTGTLVATFSWPAGLTTPARTESTEVPLDGLNVDPVADGAVLYTPEWGPRTPTVGGGHLRLAMDPVTPGSMAAEPQARHLEEQVDIGADTIVSTDGARAGQMSSTRLNRSSASVTVNP